MMIEIMCKVMALTIIGTLIWFVGAKVERFLNK